MKTEAHVEHEHRERTEARPEKVEQVETIRKWLRTASAAILTDYRGLNVAEIGQLRGKLRDTGTSYKVVKNTLLARAAEELGITGLEPYLEGPTAVAVNATDPVAPARIIQEFIRTMRKLDVKGAYIEGRVLTADQVKALAEMPAKPQMQAIALGALQAPLYGLASVLTGLQRNLVYALSQIQTSKEAAA